MFMLRTQNSFLSSRYRESTFRLRPAIIRGAVTSQKAVIKAEGEGHSGPMAKPDNDENGFWDATRRAGAKWPCSCVIHHVFGPTKPRDSCLAARPFSIQRHPRIMAGRSLNSFKSRSITITVENPPCKRQDATARLIRQKRH